MAKPLLSRPFDLVMVLYFVVHIPTTILVDLQSIIPREQFPQFARAALDWHIATNGDFLVQTNPIFFKSFVWCELLLQLPLFFLLTWGLIKEAAWARIPCIIYGAHVSTTLIPILAELLFSETHPKAVPNVACFFIYLPYLVLPLALMLRMCAYDFPSKPSGKGKAKAKAS